jgi:transcriptional regulator of acetoin/glycerol metabolism
MSRNIDIVTLQKYIPIIENLPILSENNDEPNESRDDIIRMVLQNHKDVLQLRNEVEQLKQIVRQLIIMPQEDNRIVEIDAPQNLKDIEKAAIIEALEKNGGKRKLAAKDLGFSERTLYRKIIEYGITI